ncbi:MAG: VC_2705 family sodium/solute symporter [Deltaproteobacteria bacterium]|nr:VC_2705 family sodium/solute symporter [Deltaproteobacteria bacterium]
MLGYLVVFGTFVAFLWTAWAARAQAIDDFYVAGRRNKPVWSGMALSTDWMSAASILGMVGAITYLGYDGLAYVMGWTGGYVLLALLLAPHLRKFGKYTAPDFIGDRYESRGARTAAVACAVVISFVYCVAQVAGCGIVLGRLMGIGMNAAIALSVAIIIFSTVVGGLKGVTWTQCVQYVVIMVAFLVPVTVLCFRWYGHPFAQLAYGDLLQKIVAKEQSLGISPLYTDPFTRLAGWDMWVLTFVLMVGTAGLPHIMTRFFTTPDVREARSTAGWALVFIGLLYLSAPALAAFQKYLVLTEVVGRPIAALPDWVADWTRLGMCAVRDLNGDGLLQLGELHLHQDAVVLSLPEVAGLPYGVSALLAAACLAACVSTAAGLLMIISASVSHDLFNQLLSPSTPEYRRTYLSRAVVVVFAVLAGLAAAQQVGVVVQVVAWAFSLAAATFFPAIVMGVFSSRTNRHGAVVGMVGGLAITLFYIGGVRFGWPFAIEPVAGIRDQGAGIFGMIFNFLSCAVLSRLTPPPSRRIVELIDGLRFSPRP